ncbi:hypothetical protein [Catenulispora rubra]|uniref:hypothetical protein n=1 Tax=Catenulispora rubra TaxID=280293 RepID=UPI001892832A|nr:hypothetical protein [Catenulispora rubra]
MKLKLRIGRQQAQDPRPARTTAPTTAPAHVPLPRTPEQNVVRAGTFCRASEVGRTAVTEAGRAVVAIRAGRCGRWVYAEQADRTEVRSPGAA